MQLLLLRAARVPLCGNHLTQQPAPRIGKEHSQRATHIDFKAVSALHSGGSVPLRLFWWRFLGGRQGVAFREAMCVLHTCARLMLSHARRRAVHWHRHFVTTSPGLHEPAVWYPVWGLPQAPTTQIRAACDMVAGGEGQAIN
jgi:hypothetical protein